MMEVRRPSRGGSYERWSKLNRMVVKVEQTGAHFLLNVIMAVGEESRLLVSLMVLRLPRQS